MKTIEIGRKYVFLRQVQEKPGTTEKFIVLFDRYAMCKSNFQADTKNILEMPRTLIQVVKKTYICDTQPERRLLRGY